MDLVRQGVVDCTVDSWIGWDHTGPPPLDASITLGVYDRAMRCGSASYKFEPRDILGLVAKVEKEGMKFKEYDRILQILIYYPPDDVDSSLFGMCKNRDKLIDHCRNILIQKYPSIGYQLRGETYWRYKEVAKAVEVWEEADRLGVATSDMYYDSDHTFDVECMGLVPVYL